MAQLHGVAAGEISANDAGNLGLFWRGVLTAVKYENREHSGSRGQGTCCMEANAFVNGVPRGAA